MEMSELFQAAQANDRDAFSEIWQRIERRLASFVATRLGKELQEIVDVDDILQETSVLAMQSIGGLRWQGEGAFFSWLCGVSLNIIRKTSRRYLHLANADLIGRLPTNSAERPSRVLRRVERFDRLERALMQLSEDHRQVILLSRIEGLSAQEIATRMNRSPEAVHQLLWRALKKLKYSFGDTESLGLADRQLADELNNDGTP